MPSQDLMSMTESDVRAAVADLTARNRQRRDPEIEEELVRLRRDGFASIERDDPARLPPVPRRRDGSHELRELDADALDADALRDALSGSGCAVVRGLLSSRRVDELATGVDRALAAFDAGLDGAPASETSPWFARFRPRSTEHRLGSRQFMRASGGMWTVDSPRMLFEVCELLESTGVGRLATEFLGERPALSALKCNLRRVPVDTNSNWHQDGAFLGTEVRSLNLWLALSDCGVDAPGLDLVPRRLDHIVATGTEGAIFDWSVAPDEVDRAAGDVPVVRPSFAAGDALLFDHYLLHRTGVDAGMTAERHAIECWMFAPSMYPSDQIPVLY